MDLVAKAEATEHAVRLEAVRRDVTPGVTELVVSQGAKVLVRGPARPLGRQRVKPLVKPLSKET